MLHFCWLRVLVLASLVLGSSTTGAVDFVLYSQNTLHLGWGGRTNTQCTAFTTALANVDIAVFQEVMVAASPCAAAGAPLPGTFTWQIHPAAAPALGTGNYREFNLCLYRNTPRVGGPTIALTGNPLQAPAANFMRPPTAWLFNITPAGAPAPPVKQVWISSFHAIWGRNVAGRRAEAANMGAFYTTLRGSNCASLPAVNCNVIIGGDWNLPLTDPGFCTLLGSGGGGLRPAACPAGGLGARGAPNTPTSLNRAGALSQPYDHFIYSLTPPAGLVATTYPAVGGPPYPAGPPYLVWRTTVSDHLGIMADVTLP